VDDYGHLITWIMKTVLNVEYIGQRHFIELCSYSPRGVVDTK